MTCPVDAWTRTVRVRVEARQELLERATCPECHAPGVPVALATGASSTLLRHRGRAASLTIRASRRRDHVRSLAAFSAVRAGRTEGAPGDRARMTALLRAHDHGVVTRWAARIRPGPVSIEERGTAAGDTLYTARWAR